MITDRTLYAYEQFCENYENYTIKERLPGIINRMKANAKAREDKALQRAEQEMIDSKKKWLERYRMSNNAIDSGKYEKPSDFFKHAGFEVADSNNYVNGHIKKHLKEIVSGIRAPKTPKE